MKYTPARGTRLQRLLMVSVAGGTLRHDLEPSQPPRTRPSLGEVLAGAAIFALVAAVWVLLP